MILTKTKLQKIIYEELEYAILERNVIKEELRHVLTEKKAPKKKAENIYQYLSFDTGRGENTKEDLWKTEVLQAGEPVIVKFGDNIFCRPCKLVNRWLKTNLNKENSFKIVSINTWKKSAPKYAKNGEKVQKLYAEKYGKGEGIPLLVAFRGGQSLGAWHPEDAPKKDKKDPKDQETRWTQSIREWLESLNILEKSTDDEKPEGDTGAVGATGAGAAKKGPSRLVRRDAKKLYNAIEGAGTDEDTIGRVLAPYLPSASVKTIGMVAAKKNIVELNDAFIEYVKKSDGTGDLATWLEDDGENDLADDVKRNIAAVNKHGFGVGPRTKQKKKQDAGAKGAAASDGGVVTLEQAILNTKAGDVLKLIFLKDVKKGGVVTIFKAKKTYEGKVLAGGEKVNVSHEKIMFKGDNKTMTKREFIDSMKGQGDPCETLNCETSTITRGNKSKSFSDYLASPTFEEKPAETTEKPAETTAEPAETTAETTEKPAETTAEPAETTAEPAKAQGTHEVFDTYKDKKGEKWLSLRTRPDKDNGKEIARLPDGTSLVKQQIGLGHKGKWAKIKVIGGQFANKVGFAHSGWIREKAAVAKTADGGGAGKTGAPESTPEALMTFMSTDGKPLGVKEVYSNLKDLGVPSLKGRWHLQPLEDGKCTDAENCTKDGRMKRNHPIRVNFREWWKATAKWRKKKAVAKKKAPEIKPMDSFPEGGLASQGFKGEIEKGTESVVSNETNQELVQKVKDLDSQLKTMAMTINNSAHDPKLNKNARKMLDKLKKAKDKAVEAANTQAGLGDAYKGVKRKKKSSKLTKAQKRFSNSTINARRAAYKKAEAKRIEAERIKAYQKTKTPRADSKSPVP